MENEIVTARNPKTPTKGPWTLEFKECECGNRDADCDCDLSPTAILAHGQESGGAPIMPAPAVIATLGEEATLADAYVLAASWSLYGFVKRWAEKGNAEAARLVEFAEGARCPECGVYSQGGDSCLNCKPAKARVAQSKCARGDFTDDFDKLLDLSDFLPSGYEIRIASSQRFAGVGLFRADGSEVFVNLDPDDDVIDDYLACLNAARRLEGWKPVGW